MKIDWEGKEIEMGRIWAGMGWSAGKNDGFISIVGEKLHPEIGSKVYHYYLLAEEEEKDTPQLVRKLVDLIGKYKVQEIWARHHKPGMQFLDTWNAKAGERGFPSLYINKAPFSDDGLIEYHLNVLKDSLFRGQKTLYLPDGSRLKGYMRELLPEEIDTITDSDRPSIASLAYVMTALTLNEPVFEDEEPEDPDDVDPHTGY